LNSEGFKKCNVNKEIAWNTILLDSIARLEFCKCCKKIPLVLLSNTDSIHINRFQHVAGFIENFMNV
jgi:putative hydrolase of the HAD superfamily